MSAGPKMPLERAIEAAEQLRRRWDRPGCHMEIVGSVLRNVQQVGDLDFIAAHPGADAKRDLLFEAIDGMRFGAAALFGGDSGYPTVIPTKGLKHGFKMCELSVLFAEKAVGLPVQISRYDPGKRGNYGLIKLIRTGPREFGMLILAEHKRNNRLPPGQPASEDGYLRDRWGKPMPTPDEASVFRIAGVRYVAPERRREEVCAR